MAIKSFTQQLNSTDTAALELLQTDVNRWEIIKLEVPSRHRRNKVATQLLQQTLAWAEQSRINISISIDGCNSWFPGWLADNEFALLADVPRKMIWTVDRPDMRFYEMMGF